MLKELEKIAEQADGMMLADHTEADFRDWLWLKKGITASDADLRKGSFGVALATRHAREQKPSNDFIDVTDCVVLNVS